MAFPLGGGHLRSARCGSLECGEEMLVLARMQEWADGGVRVLSLLRWDGLIGDLSDFRFVRALVRSLSSIEYPRRFGGLQRGDPLPLLGHDVAVLP